MGGGAEANLHKLDESQAGGQWTSSNRPRDGPWRWRDSHQAAGGPVS